MNKILRTIFLVIFGIIIGTRLYWWNANTLAGNSLPMPFGYGVSVVLTGSMEPTIHADDVVLVKKYKEGEIPAVGDIVVYSERSSLVIHRVIDTDGETLTTQGDANNTADDPIELSAVKGKAVWWKSGLGDIVRFMKSRLGFFIILIAAIILFEMPYRKQKQTALDEQERIKEEIRRLKEAQAGASNETTADKEQSET